MGDREVPTVRFNLWWRDDEMVWHYAATYSTLERAENILRNYPSECIVLPVREKPVR